MSEHEEYMPLLDESKNISNVADCKKKPNPPNKDTSKDTLIEQTQNAQTK